MRTRDGDNPQQELFGVQAQNRLSKPSPLRPDISKGVGERIDNNTDATKWND